MNNLDKLKMYHDRQFQCLRLLVEEWINDWTIWINHPLYKLYLDNSKKEEKLLSKFITF